jgi:glutamine amidotransferase
MQVAVIDYGAGNLRSVLRAVQAAAALLDRPCTVSLVTDAEAILAADRLVLPGQGAFRACMEGLQAQPGVIDAMTEAVRVRGRPFLGICVGLQLLADVGLEHGETPGLGWLGGACAPLPETPGARLPHMGWNLVTPTRAHPVTAPLGAGRHMYFAHSYALQPGDPADAIATCEHGAPFVAAVGRDTVAGVQFHPEKSQAVGLAVLAAFLQWTP